MKFAIFPIFALANLLGQSVSPADAPEAPPATNSFINEPESDDPNVNSRYFIESIGFAGTPTPHLSSSALDEMHRLVGSKLNSDALDGLIQKIRGELRAHDVRFKLLRGGEPDSVKVLLEVDKGASKVDVSFPEFVYNSRQGWTGMAKTAVTSGSNVFTLIGLTDGDRLIERAEGLQASYDRISLAAGHIRVGFLFEGYREDYNRSTLDALKSNSSSSSSSLGAGAYGSRMNFEPSATFVLSKPVSLTIGASFEQLQPYYSAAPSESANAVVTTLRYHQSWQSDATLEELDAGYSLRAATRMLGSGLGYSRHDLNLRYGYTHGPQSIEVKLVAGVIYGRAPLFERFVLGSSSTLLGWNKYDLDPLGGNRLGYGSVTYGYHIMRVFYDTGSVWDQGKTPEAKQSAGIGVSSGFGILQKGAFLLALAFPLRQGHPDPVLIAGMNF